MQRFLSVIRTIYSIKSTKYFLIVFLIALSIRGTYLLIVSDGELGNPDSPGYQSLAETIQTRKPYSIEEIGPGQFPMDLLRPPGYPFFLYLLNPSPETGVSRLRVAITQSLLGAIFAGFLALIAIRLFTPSIGVTAGILYALDWVTILHTPLLGADFLFSILLTLAIIAYASYLRSPQIVTWAFASGILLGLASLIKPAAQVQLVAFLLSWIFWRTRKAIGLLFVLSYLLVIAPWMVRNLQKYEILTLSTIDTAALYSYIATGALTTSSEPEGKNLAKEAELDGMAVPKGIENLTIAKKNDYMKQEALRIIRQHWGEVIKQGLRGLVLTCLGPGRETLAQSLPSGKAAPRLWSTYLPLTQNLLIWLAILVGSITLLRTPKPTISFKVLIFSALCLMVLPSASALGYSRFRVHAVPLLSILAAVGFAEVARKLRPQV